MKTVKQIRKVRKTVASIVIVIAAFAANSCEKIVEVDIPGNEISTALVFEDVQTADAALAGLYAGLWDTSPVAGSTSASGAVLGTYTDELDCFIPVSNSIGDLFLNSHTPSNQVVQSYWTSAYQLVYRANAILEGVENSTALPEAHRKRIRGEALFVRSVIYFYLQQVYGAVPYVTSTDYRVNQALPKTGAAEMQTLMTADLTESETLLADSYRNTERIFPNRKAAELMRAKILMLQQQWVGAETLLKGIVNSPVYKFETDITKVFLKTGQHIIWQLKPKNTGDATKEATGYYFAGAAPSSFALTTNLVSAFAAGDLRKQHWMTAVTVGTNTWYRPNKYKNRSANTTEYSVVFRLEEAYLLLAETLAMQNKTAEALPWINAVRVRAGGAPLVAPVSQADLLTQLLQENRKEFFTEMGQRFLTLKRMNRFDLLTAAKPNWQSHHSVWPLPEKELLLNPYLKPQNTGY